MCADPADEQMNLFIAKHKMTDHPVIIPADIEYCSIAAVAQQIRRAKRC